MVKKIVQYLNILTCGAFDPQRSILELEIICDSKRNFDPTLCCTCTVLNAKYRYANFSSPLKVKRYQ